jgi:acyl carrier protein
MSSVAEQLFVIIKDLLGIEITKNEYEKNITDLGISSLQYIELVIKIETHFDIEFGDDEMSFDYFKNMSAFVEYIEAIVV